MVGSLMSESGTSTGGETLTGRQWQTSDVQNGAFSDVAGATSQTYTIAETLRCKWLRCRVAYDDGGNTVYAESNQVRVGPCGHGGRQSRAKVVRTPRQEEPAPAMFPQVVKRARNIVPVDLSKWSGYGPTNR